MIDTIFTVFETRDKAREVAKDLTVRSVEYTYKAVRDTVFDKWMIIIIDQNGFVVGNV